MLKFYEVDGDYIKYLKEFGDNKIPNIDYKKHKKFFCGVVLKINNFSYFAPVSSYNKKTHTTFLIMDKNKKSKENMPISSLRFSFMFPCPNDCLKLKDFSKEDEKYKILLRKELHYCNINIEKVQKLANEVYRLGLNKLTRENFNICNFKVLEEKCLQYKDYRIS